MKKFAHIIGFCVLLGLCIGCAFGFIRYRAVPRYEGRSINDWLGDFDYVGSSIAVGHAAKAVGAMGTNAVPFLLENMCCKDSGLRVFLLSLLQNQNFFPVRFRKASIRHSIAADAFWVLGTQAECAIPDLAVLATNKDSASGACMALAGISGKALPVLLNTLTNQDAFVRTCAARALGKGFESTNFTLKSTMPLGTDADACKAVWALISALGDLDPGVRQSAVSALGDIARVPERAVPALIQRLGETNALCRRRAVAALRAYGSSARPALPAVTEALEDADATVRRLAASAIQAIKSEDKNDKTN
ncbi:MAG: HEAT repeat domain-containing protein [Verrucomicrobiota bacterium]